MEKREEWEEREKEFKLWEDSKYREMDASQVEWEFKKARERRDEKLELLKTTFHKRKDSVPEGPPSRSKRRRFKLLGAQWGEQYCDVPGPFMIPDDKLSQENPRLPIPIVNYLEVGPSPYKSAPGGVTCMVGNLGGVAGGGGVPPPKPPAQQGV